MQRLGVARIPPRDMTILVAAGVNGPMVMPFALEAGVATGYLHTIGALPASASAEPEGR